MAARYQSSDARANIGHSLVLALLQGVYLHVYMVHLFFAMQMAAAPTNDICSEARDKQLVARLQGLKASTTMTNALRANNVDVAMAEVDKRTTT